MSPYFLDQGQYHGGTAYLHLQSEGQENRVDTFEKRCLLGHKNRKHGLPLCISIQYLACRMLTQHDGQETERNKLKFKLPVLATISWQHETVIVLFALFARVE